MGKLVVMILLSGLLSACSSGPVRVHSADVSVDDTRSGSATGIEGLRYLLSAGTSKKGRC